MDEDVKEAFATAIEELKRADHLIYVSLKYTRTVDVIKNILSRLISAIDFAIETLLLLMLKEKLIDEVPKSPGLRCELLTTRFNDDESLELINFYLFLRRVNRATFTRFQEFRRHVTMSAVLDDNVTVEVDIDTLFEYFEKTKKFISKVEAIIKHD